MKQEDVILVVGANGLIGDALARRLAREGRQVLRTVSSGQPRTEVLDLSRDATGWRPPRPVSVAYLCAGATSLEYCHSHPVESRAINVVATVALATTLAKQGVRVVFPSSNLVFDGSRPFQKTDAPLCPRTEYGRQKAEAEQQLQVLPGVCVVRFTKVFGPAAPLLARWTASLRNREPVRPFSDMVMAPVPVGFAVEVLCRIAVKRLEGVVQVSANQDVTYEQAARRIAGRIGAPRELVQPLSTVDSGLAIEHLPINTTLDTARLRDQLDLAPPDAWTAVELAMRPGISRRVGQELRR